MHASQYAIVIDAKNHKPDSALHRRTGRLLGLQRDCQGICSYMGGITAVSCNPGGLSTRAQLAVILYRWLARDPAKQTNASGVL